MEFIKKYLERFLPFIFVFIAGLYRPYDPDLGWHLKYGEYFFKYHKLLRDNIFSTMMPNFKWPDTDWGVDLISYFVYHHLGFLGLTLLSALVVTLTFLFFSKAFKLDYFEKALIFPILLYIETPTNSVSFRGQLVSILFLGILFYIIEKYDLTKSKIIYFVPLLFLLWANLNGQYVLGLGLFGMWSALYLVRQYFNFEKKISAIKNEMRILVTVFISSTLAILINPFGIGIYQETLNHVGNQYLKNVAEYLPFKESTGDWWNQLIIGLLISLGFLLIFFNGEFKKKFPMFSIIGILYVLSWTVRRYAWSFYYIAIPFIKPIVYFVRPDSKKYQFLSATVLFVIYISIAVLIKMPFTKYSDMSWSVYCNEFANCSDNAALFIIENKLNNNKLMTTYDWGGWLIWNYPEIKPSIDGRMHVWVDDKGYTAFGDYYSYEQNFKNINESQFDTVFMSPEKDLYNQMLDRVRDGSWKMVYKDNVSGIFVRNKL